MLQFFELFIYQTTYFLLGIQSLCFLLLFGKYHAKWRDIFLCFCLILLQCVLVGFNYSYPNIPTLNTSNYICFIICIVTFTYMMRLLYLIAKAKNEIDKHSNKDFRYLSLIIAVLFVIIVAKMIYDFV